MKCLCKNRRSMVKLFLVFLQLVCLLGEEVKVDELKVENEVKAEENPEIGNELKVEENMKVENEVKAEENPETGNEIKTEESVKGEDEGKITDQNQIEEEKVKADEANGQDEVKTGDEVKADEAKGQEEVKTEDEVKTDETIKGQDEVKPDDKDEESVFIRTTAPSTTWCYQTPQCGESTWEDLCSTGKFQSPIDLPEIEDPDSNCLIKHFPHLSYNSHHFTLETNGRTVGIKLLDNVPNFRWKEYNASYSLHSIHLHWGDKSEGNESKGGSEHTLNSKRFALEMHLIHYRDDFDSVRKAFESGEKNAFAIIAFWFELEPKLKKSWELEPIIKYLPGVFYPNATNTIRDKLNLRAFMRGDVAYSYRGSLTSPSCDEQVVWLVWKRPSKVSPSDLEVLRNVTNTVGEPLINNFRSTQKLNGRKVKLCEIQFDNRRRMTN